MVWIIVIMSEGLFSTPSGIEPECQRMNWPGLHFLALDLSRVAPPFSNIISNFELLVEIRFLSNEHKFIIQIFSLFIFTRKFDDLLHIINFRRAFFAFFLAKFLITCEKSIYFLPLSMFTAFLCVFENSQFNCRKCQLLGLFSEMHLRILK